MKSAIPASATDAVKAVLYGNNIHWAAELYTFYFSGVTYTWTTFDSDLTFSGVTWYRGPVLSKWRGKLTAGFEVDEQEIVLDPGGGLLAGMTMKLAAARGFFDGVRVVVQRAYMSEPGTIVGVVPVFDGVIDSVEPGSTEIRLTV